jgi:acetyltransferase-like isoleucine patch superfamily enzyme
MHLNPVLIDEDCYIAAGVMIAPGAHIGRDSLVALGCVVKRDKYEQESMLFGNPTQVRKRPPIEGGVKE